MLVYSFAPRPTSSQSDLKFSITVNDVLQPFQTFNVEEIQEFLVFFPIKELQVSCQRSLSKGLL